jgi:hypothetical protein
MVFVAPSDAGDRGGWVYRRALDVRCYGGSDKPDAVEAYTIKERPT